MNMTPKQVNRLIEHVGGTEAFARLIGIDYRAKGQPQRIANWRHRGIPDRVLLENYGLLKRLRRQAGV